MVSITFDGVSAALLAPLPSQLAQQPGIPLDPGKVRASLRSLYATGLYQTIEVAGVRDGNNVSIIFTGAPRLFVGRVNVDGVKDDRLASVLESATQLQAGTAILRKQSGSGSARRQHLPAEQWLLPGHRSPEPPSSTGKTRWSTCTSI